MHHLGYKRSLFYKEATYNGKDQNFLKVRKVQKYTCKSRKQWKGRKLDLSQSYIHTQSLDHDIIMTTYTHIYRYPKIPLWEREREREKRKRQRNAQDLPKDDILATSHYILAKWGTIIL